ncbi:MAG: hypothetical protein C0594_11685 [Marinilabiliales bacterium]|nr:MAG: hypothetical protein C0594_11685 [Marinilabiliales bacterium]
MKIKILIILIWFTQIFAPASAQFTVNTTINNPTCYGYNDGSIGLTLSGGTTPYTISWYENSNLMTVDQTNTQNGSVILDSIDDGTYITIAVDNNGVTLIDTFYLSAPYQITTIDTITDVSCYAGTGNILTYPQGGIGFYQGIFTRHIWDENLNDYILDDEWADTTYTNADTLYFNVGIAAGYYTLHITDNLGSGCTISYDYEINQPSAPLTLTESHSHNICKNSEEGTIQIYAKGGTPPYSYNWSNSETTSSLINLHAGTYTVNVHDLNGCSLAETIDIEEPFQDLIPHIEKVDVSCHDNQDGAIEVTYIENGEPPYVYQWSNEASIEVLSDLADGNYVVTITDANNCTITDTVVVNILDIDCITINNVITPDGNNKNDTWIIENIDLYPMCDVFVYDRWGKQVFASTGGYDNSWGATSGGKILDNGDYYYVVSLNTGSYPTYKGPLKIMK